MKHFLKAFLYGIAVWAVPFTASMLIFPIRESERPLFESIMPVVVALSVVLFAVFYMKNIEINFLSESIRLGILWLIISIAVDLLFFSTGPMQINTADYMKDIGITYLIIPVITIGLGWLEEIRFKKLMKWVPAAK